VTNIEQLANAPVLEEMADDPVWGRVILQVMTGPVDESVTPVFIGQRAVKRQIKPFLNATEAFPNTLILGEPGIGKTNLARWIAHERDESFAERLCPVAPGDIDEKVVLLDECHQQRTPEPLFEIMENRHVTVLGATTRPSQLNPAFRSRFFLELHLMPYPVNEMHELVRHLAGENIPDDAAAIFASASAGNPRQAERIVMTAKRMNTYDPNRVLAICRITADGLTEMHLRYLSKLKEMKRPVGLNQLAMLLYSDDQTLRNLERVLTEYKLIELLPNGRVISSKGGEYLKRLDSL